MLKIPTALDVLDIRICDFEFVSSFEFYYLMKITQFKKLPILGILRGIEPAHVEPLTEAVIAAGLQTIEITMNTPQASKLIRQMIKAAHGKLTVGAGTVLTLDDLHAALDAGATFIVMPTFIKDVMAHCAKNSIPAFPGAFTPQEIYLAWQAGATMVKVFPAQFLGPKYFKEIKGPFQDIELLACGGVTPENIGEYFKSGASAVSFGASVFKKEWLSAGQYSSITESIKGLIQRLPV